MHFNSIILKKGDVIYTEIAPIVVVVDDILKRATSRSIWFSGKFYGVRAKTKLTHMRHIIKRKLSKNIMLKIIPIKKEEDFVLEISIENKPHAFQ